MKIGHKGRLAFLIVVQLLALTLVGLFAYRPSVAAIRDTEERIAQLSQRQAGLCKLLEENPNPDAEMALAKAEIRRLENRMPPESRLSWLSARIAAVMAAHDVELRSATDWSEGRKKPPAAELKWLQKAVTVRCSGKDLQAFLQSLNKLSFVVVVEDLAVRRDQKCGTVSAEIKLGTFVLRARPTTRGNTVDRA